MLGGSPGPLVLRPYRQPCKTGCRIRRDREASPIRAEPLWRSRPAGSFSAKAIPVESTAIAKMYLIILISFWFLNLKYSYMLPATAYIHRSDSPRSEVDRTREREPRGSKSSFCAYSAGHPIVPPGLLSGIVRSKVTYEYPSRFSRSGHGILTNSNGPRHRESSRTWLGSDGGAAPASSHHLLQVRAIEGRRCTMRGHLGDR